MKRKMAVLMFLAAVVLTLAACSSEKPTPVTFDQQFVARPNSYICEEEIGDNVVVYLMSVDASPNQGDSTKTDYKKWYVNHAGQAVEHNTTLTVATTNVVQLPEPATLPFEGWATSIP